MGKRTCGLLMMMMMMMMMLKWNSLPSLLTVALFPLSFGFGCEGWYPCPNTPLFFLSIHSFIRPFACDKNRATIKIQ
ncbi:hypothetical protein BKA57DRAFT_446973 [Linnemannia elongata]|nr:hypothetical protein BKA57DRAFT_446973 [Linnemannia elongata]